MNNPAAKRRTAEELTGPFWRAIEASTLMRPVCGNCGRSHFSPQVVCPHCQAPDWAYEPSSGLGHVYSHTTVHRPPDPSFEAPYVVADIELDEGWRMFSWVVNCDPASVHIDMAVRVCFAPHADRMLPMFEPAPVAP